MDYELALILKSKVTPSQLAAIKTRLYEYKPFEVSRTQETENESEQTLQLAHQLRLLKKVVKSTPETRSSTISQKLENQNTRQLPERTVELETYKIFTIESKNDFISDSNETIMDIFNPEEKIRMILLALNTIKLKDTAMFKLSRNSLYSLDKDQEEVNLDSSLPLLLLLGKCNILKGVTPIHDQNYLNSKLLTQTSRDFSMSSSKDSKEFRKVFFRDYFGDQAAFYFEFVRIYQRWLSIPALIGFLVWIINFYEAKTSQTSQYDAFYGFFVVIWFQIFIKFWERKSNSLAAKWGSFDSTIQTVSKNPHFEGKRRINPVTGYPEFHFSRFQRFRRYIFSLCCSLPFVFLITISMIITMNLRGFISPKQQYLYLQDIAAYSQKGQLFDKQSFFGKFPSILESILLVGISVIHKKICLFTTQLENHKSLSAQHNSLIVKRFILDILTVYLTLCYIAFVERDINALSETLQLLFISDQIRRVVVESLIPTLLKKQMVYALQKAEQAKVKLHKDIQDTSQETYLKQKIAEISLYKYDEFDDYFEMTSQYGYNLLFASAFPLSCLFSFIFNFIEIKSDTYKIRNVFRRPIPRKSSGIGSWLDVIKWINFCSIFTNLILFSFCSDQVFTLFPWLLGEHVLNINKDSSYEVEVESRIKNILMIILLMEHIFLIIYYLIDKCIKNKPYWLDLYFRRRQFQKTRDRSVCDID